MRSYSNQDLNNRNIKKYDFVIYGGTGYTGKFVVEEVARVANSEYNKGLPLKWAIAGRNKLKISNLLNDVAKNTGINMSSVELIETDNEKQETLNEMASQAKVVLNCVGPYYLHGEPVIKACIENKSNHVDISGEPLFLDSMRLKYDKAAEESGIHIVNACGYDSVPADVGLCHMIKHFPGILNSAECYVRIRGGSGSSIHTGTMESAALAVANRDKVQGIRQLLYKEKLPKPKFKKEKRGILHKNADLERPMWALPLPTDEPMVYASQRYLFHSKGQRPVQFQGFVAFPSFFKAFFTLLGAVYFLGLCLFSFTRNILIKYPEVMTAGTFTRKGPTKKQLEKMTFTSTIIGKGWKKPEAVDTCPPESKISVKITGPDPGYGATSLMMVACAMTILRDKSRCERKGGVMTPGSAFMNTSLVNRMIDRGMKVEVKEDEE